MAHKVKVQWLGNKDISQAIAEKTPGSSAEGVTEQLPTEGQPFLMKTPGGQLKLEPARGVEQIRNEYHFTTKNGAKNERYGVTDLGEA